MQCTIFSSYIYYFARLEQYVIWSSVEKFVAYTCMVKSNANIVKWTTSLFVSRDNALIDDSNLILINVYYQYLL